MGKFQTSGLRIDAQQIAAVQDWTIYVSKVAMTYYILISRSSPADANM